jgi:hypothetical protein
MHCSYDGWRVLRANLIAHFPLITDVWYRWVQLYHNVLFCSRRIIFLCWTVSMDRFLIAKVGHNRKKFCVLNKHGRFLTSWQEYAHPPPFFLLLWYFPLFWATSLQLLGIRDSWILRGDDFIPAPSTNLEDQVSLFVRHLVQNLSGMGGPTRS